MYDLLAIKRREEDALRVLKSTTKEVTFLEKIIETTQKTIDDAESLKRDIKLLKMQRASLLERAYDTKKILKEIAKLKQDPSFLSATG